MAPTVGSNGKQQAFTQRQHTTRDDWTPKKVRDARRRAELGDLMLAADLVEYLQTDDRANGVLSTRVRGLLKSPISFQAATETEGPTPLTEALEADFWDAYPETDLGQLTSWGLMLGVAIGQHIWETNDAGRMIPRLQVWHPRWLKYRHRDDTWVVSTEDSGEVPIEAGDGQWVVYTPYGSHNPWRHGLYRAVAPWWLLKRYAIMDWGSYSEAHGHPLRVATTPDTSSQADRLEVAQDLENIAGVTGMGMPAGFDLKLVEATSRTWETFRAQIDAANNGIAIAITGQNLTTEVEGGSLAAARVHDVIRHDLIESDEQTLSTTLRDQWIVLWTILNFLGASESDAPWARWDTAPPEDPPTIEAHHIQSGAVTKNDIRKSVGLPPFDDPAFDEPIPEKAPEPTGFGAGLSRGRQGVRLATGGQAPGMIAGQAYLDRLASRGAPLEPVKETARKLSALIESANSYDEVLDGLPGIVDDIDDGGVMIEALLMATAAGAASEQDDHPEGD